MGDEAEIRESVTRVRAVRLDDDGKPTGEMIPLLGAELSVTPSVEDTHVVIPVLDLVGKELERDDGYGSATARLDGDHVVIEYPDLGEGWRTMIHKDAQVRVRRRR